MSPTKYATAMHFNDLTAPGTTDSRRKDTEAWLLDHSRTIVARGPRSYSKGSLSSAVTGLILRVHGASIAVGRVGYSADIGYKRLNVRLAQGVSPGWHERRLIEGRTPMTDDGSEI